MREVEFGGIEEALEEPPIRWLIPDWLPGQELTLLWGREGTFKSFIALGWSLELAAQGRTVVYIAAEGLSGLRARLQAWLVAHDQSEKKMTAWHYFNSNIYLNEAPLRKRWADVLKQYLNPGWQGGRGGSWTTPDLIVVDTLDRCYGGEENSSKEMGQFIDGLEELRRDLRTALLVVHHTRKEGDRERGTTALPAAVFASHHVSSPAARPSKGGASVQVQCMKMKDAATPAPVRMELDRMEFTHDVTPDLEEVVHSSLALVGSRPVEEREPISEEKPLDAPQSKSDEVVAIGLAIKEHGGSVTGQQFQYSMGFNNVKAANRRLHKWAKKGLIVKDKSGKYRLAKGRKTASRA